MIKIFGIKNCDTMKKAFRFLEENSIAYNFHDYKKQGVDEGVLKLAIKEHGWETIINKRGTTWRALPDSVKNTMNDETVITAATKNPSLIKRPLLLKNGSFYLGFNEKAYETIFEI